MNNNDKENSLEKSSLSSTAQDELASNGLDQKENFMTIEQSAIKGFSIFGGFLRVAINNERSAISDLKRAIF